MHLLYNLYSWYYSGLVYGNDIVIAMYNIITLYYMVAYNA